VTCNTATAFFPSATRPLNIWIAFGEGVRMTEEVASPEELIEVDYKPKKQVISFLF